MRALALIHHNKYIKYWIKNKYILYIYQIIYIIIYAIGNWHACAKSYVFMTPR